jgi:hypothetical protein
MAEISALNTRLHLIWTYIYETWPRFRLFIKIHRYTATYCTRFGILLTESAFLIGQTNEDMAWIARVNIYTFQKCPRDLDEEVYRYDQICSSKCEVMHDIQCNMYHIQYFAHRKCISSRTDK